MGKFEKLIVLSVFLAAAVVLAVALNRGKAQLESPSPLRGAQEVVAREKPAARPTQLPPERSESRPVVPEPTRTTSSRETVRREEGTSLLLNAGTERPAPSAKLGVEPVSNRERRILGSDAGLRPSFLEEYMVYTVATGDTWASLAQRFYQDGRYARNLQQANDGMTKLAPAVNILVPVFDFIEMDAGLQPGLAASAPVGTLPVASRDETPGGMTPTAPIAGTQAQINGQVYVVQTGDTLSDLSKAVFGSATRWKELLDANTDVLKKPEALQVGMKLKIPAGGKLPEVREASAPKPTTQPAAAKSEPKKSKVD